MYRANLFKKCAKIIGGIIFICALKTHACEQLSENDIPVLLFPPKFDSKSPEQDYVFQLIQLILKKSNKKFGPCEVRLFDQKLPLKRLELYLQKNHFLHAAALTVSNERDERFLAIPIPISKGLTGYRVLMIHKEQKNKFSKVNNIKDLSNYVAGQGIGWADVGILEYNNLPVLTSGSIITLIDMLAHGRFDYFPRSALQNTTEKKAYQDKSIKAEPTLILSYPSMTALYVNSNNISLAQRLEYGLKQALDDGSFNDFFYSHPYSVQALLILNLKNRKILTICNPLLPSWVPLEKSEYWLEPWPEEILSANCKPADIR
ncbi:MAG: hypothetical protein HRT54_21025 [Colwellia sp.]|nr:hypothetical protein [Colwellia sp.]